MHTQKLIVGLGLGAALLAGVASAQTSSGLARIVDAHGLDVGTAALVQVDDGVQISGEVAGLAPGAHGMHIHAQGTCEGPDFMSAGGHFNPHARKHGLATPDGAHAGDLPNVEVAPDGHARVDIVAHGVRIVGDGPDSLFKAGGTALVVHAGPDDGATDPSGNSGGRIACGAIVAGPIALPRAGGFDIVQTAGLIGGLVLVAGVMAGRMFRKGTTHGHTTRSN